MSLLVVLAYSYARPLVLFIKPILLLVIVYFVLTDCFCLYVLTPFIIHILFNLSMIMCRRAVGLFTAGDRSTTYTADVI